MNIRKLWTNQLIKLKKCCSVWQITIQHNILSHFHTECSRTKDIQEPDWPCGSAFLKAFPASIRLVAASCLLCICRWRWAALENAFPAAESRWFGVITVIINTVVNKEEKQEKSAFLPHQFFAILYMLAALTYMSQASSNLEEPLENTHTFLKHNDLDQPSSNWWSVGPLCCSTACNQPFICCDATLSLAKNCV